jgi:AP-3 complex subunit delta-1
VDSLLGNLESAEGHYRDELIAKIIFMCSRDKYAYLADFAWYVEVLSKLASMEGTNLHAATVANQLLDVTVRVEDVRPTAMSKLIPMLADANFIKNAGLLDELKDLNWAGFAKGYNGPAYAQNKYDEKLATAYDKYA